MSFRTSSCFRIIISYSVLDFTSKEEVIHFSPFSGSFADTRWLSLVALTSTSMGRLLSVMLHVPSTEQHNSRWRSPKSSVMKRCSTLACVNIGPEKISEVSWLRDGCRAKDDFSRLWTDFDVVFSI